MRLFRKSLFVALCLALAGGAMAKKDDKDKKEKPGATPAAVDPNAPAKKPDDPKKPDSKKSDDKKPGDKKPDDKKKDKKDKKKKGEPESTPAKAPTDGTAAATPAPDEQKKMSIPIPPDHPSRGLKIPYYDTKGNLQMVFNIGLGERKDADHIEMTDTQVETYNEEGETDMTVQLPVSMLDVNTRVITSQTKTTITRDDFKITGDAVEFDTNLRTGKLVGNVHMTIYKADMAAKPSAVPELPKPDLSALTAPAKPE